MKILFAGDQPRSEPCLEAVSAAGFDVAAVLIPASSDSTKTAKLAGRARLLGIPLLGIDELDAPASLNQVRELGVDVAVFAGFSRIARKAFLNLFPLGCINLHAGKLPEYRGSSPLNWALISGEDEFTLSVIKVDEGVDSGPVLRERRFRIGSQDTIADLHRTANEMFPGMLVDVLTDLREGLGHQHPQDSARARYFPLRFPDDGLIVWDMQTARQIHNQIRALTSPCPGAFTFYQGRKVLLLDSAMAEPVFVGEPGRIYRIHQGGLLVCGLDRALWIRKAEFADGSGPLAGLAKRYERLLSVRDALLQLALKEAK